MIGSCENNIILITISDFKITINFITSRLLFFFFWLRFITYVLQTNLSTFNIHNKESIKYIKKNYVIDVILIKFITNFWEGAQLQ